MSTTKSELDFGVTEVNQSRRIFLQRASLFAAAWPLAKAGLWAGEATPPVPAPAGAIPGPLQKADPSGARLSMLFVPGEITAREHCFDRITPLVKHLPKPVLSPEKPWETMSIEAASVIYSPAEKLFRMWYVAWNKGPWGKHESGVPIHDNWTVTGRWFLCYAQSSDGIHWDRPALGLVKSKEFPDNNIILADSGLFLNLPTVIEDADDPDPGRRFKLFYYDHDGAGRDGGRTAVSPDGLHWQFVGDFPVLPTEDAPCLWHDRRNGLYVAFLKSRIDNKRSRMVSVSRDFAHWSPPTVLLTPDLGDAPTVQFYDQCAFHQCGHDFGFMGRLDQATQKLDMELIVSARGGADWRRLPTRPQMLAQGNVTDWDGTMVRCTQGEPIVMGDTCWVYYMGANAPHEVDCPYSVGLATFPYGRLVGQWFENDGWFQSAPFLCPGGTLTLDAKATQPISVEVWGCGYTGLQAGYSRKECIPVEGDSRKHAIRWTTAADLEYFRGKFITLRVYGHNSVVYGASFA